MPRVPKFGNQFQIRTQCQHFIYLFSSIFFFKKNFLIRKVFIFGCAGPSLLHLGFLWLRRVGATLHCSAQASLVEHRLWSACSAVAVRRLSSSSACGNLPGAEVEPMSPALVDRFLTIRPPGKHLVFVATCRI